jgi:hypothetical protein
MCSTYGVWLRGDPRGWRTRHHREHVNGDYKHPPRAGTWESTYKRSLHLMTQAGRTPITLAEPDRQLVIAKIVEALQHHHIQVLAAALGGEHLHVLAQFAAGTPRKWIGIAKKHAARHLCDLSRVPPGGIWGKRSECKPIADRAHQLVYCVTLMPTYPVCDGRG